MKLIKELAKLIEDRCDLKINEDFSKSKTYFHGGYIHPNASVIFFADSFDTAKEFAETATPDGKYVVIEAKLNIANPASQSVLEQIIEKSGITEEEMGDILDHDVEDETDYLQSPKIVSMLKQAGYDGVVAKGVFDGFDIDEFVIFNQSQMSIVKTHEI